MRGSGVSEQLLTIGIDIGGTNLRAAVVDENGQVLDVEQLPTPPSSEALEMAVVAVVDKLRARHEGVAAVGLAVAGFVDENQQMVRFAPHLPWRETPVKRVMSRALELPVILEHDANSAAWGEHEFGAARDAKNWVLLALGTGIGGAIMMNGEIYRGAFGVAPEFGHLTVVPNGRSCPCGKRGCLERYCSGSALPLTAQDLIARGRFPHSRLAQDFGKCPEEISGRAVVRMAREGDELAQAVIKDMGTWLGRGLAMIQDVLDPELIVVAGGVAVDADLLLDYAQDVMGKTIVGAGSRPVARVAVAELGSQAGMIGVAKLARTLLPEQ
ncbi:ROK family protein [Corynebacterium sp. ED61]|uniref:ROK family protein n=1 Tax=Corynebacterium sp. ED61 TaxID=2211360 RepID=UPI0018838151|nr:ROK family protein [Corynebacterium sp. ED61]MBF0580733.1 ROK family protein [Corynebacterium sp. ED61]